MVCYNEVWWWEDELMAMRMAASSWTNFYICIILAWYLVTVFSFGLEFIQYLVIYSIFLDFSCFKFCYCFAVLFGFIEFNFNFVLYCWLFYCCVILFYLIFKVYLLLFCWLFICFDLYCYLILYFVLRDLIYFIVNYVIECICFCTYFSDFGFCYSLHYTWWLHLHMKMITFNYSPASDLCLITYAVRSGAQFPVGWYHDAQMIRFHIWRPDDLIVLQTFGVESVS